MQIIGTLAVQWGRVGHLKLSSARANLLTGLSCSLQVMRNSSLGLLNVEFSTCTQCLFKPVIAVNF